MLFKFINKETTGPKRVVILGNSGIIASNLFIALKKLNIKVISFGRSKLDLKKENATNILVKKIKNDDVVIFIAAEAPVKNIKMFSNNLKICSSVSACLDKKKVKHLIYISSDAVYADIRGKLSENSLTLPTSLHGFMHLTRELILKNKFKNILCVLRPTLIYGKGDTHKGYGPNRFANLALQNKAIQIFGNGSELRDHIYIDDLTKIIVKCIQKRAIGTLNLATGKVYSFKYLAKLTIRLLKKAKQCIKAYYMIMEWMGYYLLIIIIMVILMMMAILPLIMEKEMEFGNRAMDG